VRIGSVASRHDENKMGLNLLEIMGVAYVITTKKEGKTPGIILGLFIQKNKEIVVIFL